MKEKRLVDANHFMQVLKNIEYALKGELTHGKIKTSVVQMIEGSLNAEPTIAPGEPATADIQREPGLHRLRRIYLPQVRHSR